MSKRFKKILLKTQEYDFSFFEKKKPTTTICMKKKTL